MEAWDEAVHDRIAGVLEPVHVELAERLSPAAGERWLDLTHGNHTIADRAKARGADVMAFDGDPEYLPCDDGEFDVVSSAFGFIWAPDHANVAAELARVTQAGGRIGFTAWKPNPKLGELYRRFTDEPLDGRESTEWGREDHVEGMLGDDFELEFEDGTLWIDAESGEELWELFSTSSPPVVSLLRKLDERGTAEFHQAFVELFESYREADRVRAPRRYLLTLGRRR
ncbi:MAG TPA: methyltransferase domain-containing protein [Gaiellaceae bacterium]